MPYPVFCSTAYGSDRRAVFSAKCQYILTLPTLHKCTRSPNAKPLAPRCCVSASLRRPAPNSPSSQTNTKNPARLPVLFCCQAVESVCGQNEVCNCLPALVNEEKRPLVLEAVLMLPVLVLPAGPVEDVCSNKEQQRL